MITESSVRDILKSLSLTNYPCFTSEAQLRDAFAIELGLKHSQCIIMPEYTSPLPYGWRCSEKLVHFDLLVIDKESNEKILFEFKYKTIQSEFDNNSMHIYLADQSDTTNGRYAIWRDIYRIETFINSNDISKGYIIFVSNSSSYWASPRPGTISKNFSIEPGFHKAENKEWTLPRGVNKINCKSIIKSYRDDKSPLIITNNYFFEYSDYSKLNDINGKSHTFTSLMLPIYSKIYLNNIEKLLRKIGKSVFINNYYDLKGQSRLDCINIINGTNHTKNSSETIVSNSKKLFNEKLSLDALRIIISSQKLQDQDRKLAEKILSNEILS